VYQNGVIVMRVAIIGAGPAGLFLGAGLARRGHRVIAVERDQGPAADGTWPRRGVMQFHHAHAFRPQVAQALEQELPEALRRWLAAGAEPVRLRLPDGREMPAGMRSRRTTFERALRAAALTVPGFEIRHGHAEDVTSWHGRADGIRVDGVILPADLVIDASGRAGRATRSLRPAVTSGGRCGIAYVDRQYQLLPGAEPGPLANAIVWQAELDGYQVLVFVHENGIFSVLLARPIADPVLAQLRHEAAFTAACRAIPGLADWTDPDRARPITPVLPGGPLHNAYRGQTGPDGRLARPGLVFAGDAVATTTPTFGRGVATTLLQAQQLLRLTDEHGTDTGALGESFDAWCTEHIKPWVDDHVQMDEAIQRRWAGEGVDLSQPLPSDLILAAAEADHGIRAVAGGYLSMTELPASLRTAEPRARALYASGWRRRPAPGPSRAELAEIVLAALRVAALPAAEPRTRLLTGPAGPP
jgi:2-polyprenyl-6-methoxyphenol hydroxylase-like FAD-dependent oxidoreductase